jgi:hypothetical protein
VRFVAILLLGSGCFYPDRINQRPSADIVQDSSNPVTRGSIVDLHADTDDPDGDHVSVRWRVYACTDATVPAGCDPMPYLQWSDPQVQVPVKSTRDDGTPVQSLRVILEATDSLGATAQPSQELLLAVVDAAPDLTVSSNSHYHAVGTTDSVVGMPIALYAQATDPDPGDTPDKLTVDFAVVQQPVGSTFTLTDLVLSDASQHGKLLVPSMVGEWQVDVTAKDPLQHATMKSLPLKIVDDSPPCLESRTPLDPPPGQSLPIHDPTLFQVLVVDDDLDPYPPVPNDPLMGTTRFSWSLLLPGGTTRVPLSVIGNSVALDPASYAPGDVIELRVEIFDREATPIPCNDAMTTCAVNATMPSCMQRLTWRVEVQ